MSETSLKFGTSGLRGLIADLVGLPTFAYTYAFAEMLKEGGAAAVVNGIVLVGRDLRSSSPAIAQQCCAALQHAALTPLDCGALPTPALAAYARRTGNPAIMVTGSHIPEDRNGLKFYRAEGEINKQDEQRIQTLYAQLGLQAVPDSAQIAPIQSPDEEPLVDYRNRYLAFFALGSLSGLTVGVYQHSSVARDILVDVLEALGAQVIPLGRASQFVPVDTEALREEDTILVRRWAADHALDAIVSTDGDADRPLIADATGTFLRGDLVGAMTARALKADAVVTPVTSNSALEFSSAFMMIVRTQVGSPYVISGMTKAARAGARAIVGFEANGGVLLGTDIEREGRILAALPTRDAMLPILCVLSEIVRQSRPLAKIVAEFNFQATASNRLPNTAQERSAAFLARLEQDPIFQDNLMQALGGVAVVDARDGVRLTAHNGEIVHFRASGNAPELRVYVEAATIIRAESLLTWALDLAHRQVS